MNHFQQALVFLALRRGATVLCFVAVLLSTQVLSAQPSGNSVRNDELKLVWTADYGQGEQVYFSSYEKESWSAPVQLSDSTDLVFQSAVSSGADGRIWVIWARQDKKRSFLEFTMYDSSRWSKPQAIETGIDRNKAVTVLVDQDNTPWIAWTGIVNMYPDIFWSRWNGQAWTPPVKAHADNNVPDIHPILSLDDSGHILLSWQTISSNKYITVAQVWDGRQWQAVSKQEAEKQLLKTAELGKKTIPSIPEFIQDSRKATLFIRGNDGSVSMPLSR